ncbi:unnamed protein product [Vitrella brassicaformis CCMP3155]|uniref:RNA-editing substrate-binding complex 6 protein domain-containing protein n=1 Tax=Vitrella brassicaformis (strain CCMP3155) TaxID=1169540 RepID=A0A0G4FVM5_VITBC|nr:unnamed protein product [Vitrella brassicaformis CCMP3155]|eukprot:CEM18599.1 unnamed protein product [Vitrella brassicaformis CCMP3155]
MLPISCRLHPPQLQLAAGSAPAPPSCVRGLSHLDVRAATSDGPQRSIRFKLRPIRHDYQNVLVNADVRHLVQTAEKLLVDVGTKKKRAFWEIFSKRAKLSMHLLQPLDMAIIGRAFDEHDKDTGVFQEMAAMIPLRITRFDGLSLVAMADLLSRRAKKAMDTFRSLCSHLPNVMHQLSLNDIVQLLFALDRVDHIDRTVCRRVSRKVAARLSHPETKTQVEAATIAGLAAAFALHQYRSHPLYRLIARRAVMLADEFDTPSLGRLFHAFNSLSLDSVEMIEGMEEVLIERLPLFSREELSAIKEYVDDSEAGVMNLRDALDQVWEVTTGERPKERPPRPPPAEDAFGSYEDVESGGEEEEESEFAEDDYRGEEGAEDKKAIRKLPGLATLTPTSLAPPGGASFYVVRGPPVVTVKTEPQDDPPRQEQQHQHQQSAAPGRTSHEGGGDGGGALVKDGREDVDMKGKGVDEDWQDDDMGGVGGYSGDEDEDRELDEDDGDNVHDSNGVQEDRQRSCSKTDRPSPNRGRFPRPPTDPHEISLRDAYVKKCTRASPTYDDVFDGLADMATFERRRPDGRREWVSFNVTVGPVNTDGDPQSSADLTKPPNKTHSLAIEEGKRILKCPSAVAAAADAAAAGSAGAPDGDDRDGFWHRSRKGRRRRPRGCRGGADKRQRGSKREADRDGLAAQQPEAKKPRASGLPSTSFCRLEAAAAAAAASAGGHVGGGRHRDNGWDVRALDELSWQEVERAFLADTDGIICSLASTMSKHRMGGRALRRLSERAEDKMLDEMDKRLGIVAYGEQLQLQEWIERAVKKGVRVPAGREGRVGVERRK